MKDNKMQEKIAQFQMIQNSMKAVEQRERMLNAGLEELSRAKLALEDLKNSKGAAYVPLGANNYVLGEIKDNENVLISIGAGIAVKKKREDAIKITDERIKEFEGEALKAAKEMRKLADQAIALQNEIENLRK